MDAFLLDTCTIVPLVRRADPKAEPIRARLRECDADGSTVNLSVITISELDYGWRRQKAEGHAIDAEEAQRLSLFMAQFSKPFPIDLETARIHAAVRAELFAVVGTKRPNGKARERLPEQLRLHGNDLGIDERDLFIVATAIQYNLMLVTDDGNEGMKRIVAASAKAADNGDYPRVRLTSWSH